MSDEITLTPEQEAQMKVYIDKYIQIGLTPEVIPEGKKFRDIVDMDDLTETVNLLYTCSDETPPPEILVFDSPKEIRNYVEQEDPSKSRGEIVSNFGFGSLDATFLSFYAWMREVIGRVEETDNLRGLLRMLRYGWYYPCREVCLVSARPVEIHLDEQNRLHYENGPAIRFNDGFQICSWHGVQVPDEWIMDKENVDPSLALTWDNIEQRRALAEIIGWAKVLERLECNELHSDWTGTLLEANLPDAPRQRFVKVLCGTGRTFAIPVPEECRTSLEAVAWTYQVPPEEYAKLEVRT